MAGDWVASLLRKLAGGEPSSSSHEDGIVGEEVRIPPGVRMSCSKCGADTRIGTEAIGRSDVRFEIVSHEVEGGEASAGVPIFGVTAPCGFCGDGVFLSPVEIQDADPQEAGDDVGRLAAWDAPGHEGERVALPAGIEISCRECDATSVTVAGTSAIRCTQLDAELALFDDETPSISETTGFNALCASCGAIAFVARSKVADRPG